MRGGRCSDMHRSGRSGSMRGSTHISQDSDSKFPSHMPFNSQDIPSTSAPANGDDNVGMSATNPMSCTLESQSSAPNETDKLIRIDKNGEFMPNTFAIVRSITKVIKSKFDEPYKNWHLVNNTVKNMWFDEFKKLWRWEPMQEVDIRTTFEKKGAERFKDILNKAHKKNAKPTWMNESVWNALKQHWDSEDFQRVSRINSKNRMSDRDGLGPSLHCGGSISINAHKRKLEHFEELKQQSTAESQIGERSSSSESMPIRSDEDIWMEAIRGPRKGRVYGMGKYGSKAIICSTLSEYIGHKSISSVNMEALRVDLLTQLREELAEENARREAEHARREAEHA